MTNKKQEHISFSKRAFVLVSAKIAMFFSLIGRLFYLQILKHEEYETQADGNRIKILLEIPNRGIIIDRFGNNLATNQKYYRIYYMRNKKKNQEQIFQQIIDLLELNHEYLTIWKKRLKTSQDKNILLKEHLSWQDVCKISVMQHELEGVFIDLGQMRFYPFSHLAAHIIGYVGPIIEEQKDPKNKLTMHPDYRIGKSGIEKTEEAYLKGEGGHKKVEVNAYGHIVKELSYQPSVSGGILKATIDTKLQDFVYNALQNKGDRGSCGIIMDISNGHLLAMASSPSYDPNKFTQGISHQDWSQLINDPYKPLLNRPIRNIYPPGSTFKLVVFIAALKHGMTEDAIVNCSGNVQVGNRVFHCWKKTGHGNLNMVEAIARSCNSYIYYIAKKVGIKNIIDVAKELGFGETVLNEISGELAGILPDSKWKQKELGQAWQIGDTANVSIGQGYLLTTPIQLVTMIARIASGKIVSPTLKFNNIQDFPDLKISQEYLKIIRKGMFMGSNVYQGTSFASRISIDKYKMAAKTGTSQVISKKHADIDLSAEHIPWENKNHGLFVGYAPYDKPRFACCVVVEHGGSGSKIAHIGSNILLEVQKKYDES